MTNILPFPQPVTFDDFWAAYPRRVGKIAAQKAYLKALAHTDPETIRAGAERYARECRVEQTEKRFIKHPATWLNAGCWDDEDYEPAPVERVEMVNLPPDEWEAYCLWKAQPWRVTCNPQLTRQEYDEWKAQL